jgi:hypothetical protein
MGPYHHLLVVLAEVGASDDQLVLPLLELSQGSTRLVFAA